VKKYAFKIAFPKERAYRSRLFRVSQPYLRGLIRSAAIREQRVVPSVKSAVRRYRVRPMAIYTIRFGNDTFVDEMNVERPLRQSRRNFLKRGYAFWRRRLTLNSTGTSAGTRQ
jgi:hypothetical protein